MTKKYRSFSVHTTYDCITHQTMILLAMMQQFIRTNLASYSIYMYKVVCLSNYNVHYKYTYATCNIKINNEYYSTS